MKSRGRGRDEEGGSGSGREEWRDGGEGERERRRDKSDCGLSFPALFRLQEKCDREVEREIGEGGDGCVSVSERKARAVQREMMMRCILLHRVDGRRDEDDSDDCPVKGKTRTRSALRTTRRLMEGNRLALYARWEFGHSTDAHHTTQDTGTA